MKAGVGLITSRAATAVRYIFPLVILAEQLAAPLEYGTRVLGAPEVLNGGKVIFRSFRRHMGRPRLPARVQNTSAMTVEDLQCDSRSAAVV